MPTENNPAPEPTFIVNVKPGRPLTDDPDYVAYVKELVSKAPPLTAAQIDVLRRIFSSNTPRGSK